MIIYIWNQWTRYDHAYVWKNKYISFAIKHITHDVTDDLMNEETLYQYFFIYLDFRTRDNIMLSPGRLPLGHRLAISFACSKIHHWLYGVSSTLVRLRHSHENKETFLLIYGKKSIILFYLMHSIPRQC
jgi:hypothetical protein